MVRVLLAITLIAIGASGWFAFNNVSTKIDAYFHTHSTEGERDTAIKLKDAEDAQKLLKIAQVLPNQMLQDLEIRLAL